MAFNPDRSRVSTPIGDREISTPEVLLVELEHVSGWTGNDIETFKLALLSHLDGQYDLAIGYYLGLPPAIKTTNVYKRNLRLAAASLYNHDDQAFRSFCQSHGL